MVIPKLFAFKSRQSQEFYSTDYDDEDTLGGGTTQSDGTHTKSILRRSNAGRNTERNVSWRDTFDTYEEGGTTFETFDTLAEERQDDEYAGDIYNSQFNCIYPGAGNFGTTPGLGDMGYSQPSFSPTTINEHKSAFSPMATANSNDDTFTFNASESQTFGDTIDGPMNTFETVLSEDMDGAVEMEHVDRTPATRSAILGLLTTPPLPPTISDAPIQAERKILSANTTSPSQIMDTMLLPEPLALMVKAPADRRLHPVTEETTQAPPPPNPIAPVAPKQIERKQMFAPGVAWESHSIHQTEPLSPQAQTLPLLPRMETREEAEPKRLALNDPLPVGYQNLACASTLSENTIEMMKDRYRELDHREGEATSELEETDMKIVGNSNMTKCSSTLSETTLELMRDRYGGMDKGEEDEENNTETNNISNHETKNKVKERSASSAAEEEANTTLEASKHDNDIGISVVNIPKKLIGTKNFMVIAPNVTKNVIVAKKTQGRKAHAVSQQQLCASAIDVSENVDSSAQEERELRTSPRVSIAVPKLIKKIIADRKSPTTATKRDCGAPDTTTQQAEERIASILDSEPPLGPPSEPSEPPLELPSEPAHDAAQDPSDTGPNAGRSDENKVNENPKSERNISIVAVPSVIKKLVGAKRDAPKVTKKVHGEPQISERGSQPEFIAEAGGQEENKKKERSEIQAPVGLKGVKAATDTDQKEGAKGGKMLSLDTEERGNADKITESIDIEDNEKGEEDAIEKLSAIFIPKEVALPKQDLYTFTDSGSLGSLSMEEASLDGSVSSSGSLKDQFLSKDSFEKNNDNFASFEDKPSRDETHLHAASDDESIVSLTKKNHDYDPIFKMQQQADASIGHIGLILPFWNRAVNAVERTLFMESWDVDALRDDLIKGVPSLPPISPMQTMSLMSPSSALEKATGGIREDTNQSDGGIEHSQSADSKEKVEKSLAGDDGDIKEEGGDIVVYIPSNGPFTQDKTASEVINATDLTPEETSFIYNREESTDSEGPTAADNASVGHVEIKRTAASAVEVDIPAESLIDKTASSFSGDDEDAAGIREDVPVREAECDLAEECGNEDDDSDGELLMQDAELRHLGNSEKKFKVSEGGKKLKGWKDKMMKRKMRDDPSSVEYLQDVVILDPTIAVSEDILIETKGENCFGRKTPHSGRKRSSALASWKKKWASINRERPLSDDGPRIQDEVSGGFLHLRDIFDPLPLAPVNTNDVANAGDDSSVSQVSQASSCITTESILSELKLIEDTAKIMYQQMMSSNKDKPESEEMLGCSSCGPANGNVKALFSAKEDTELVFQEHTEEVQSRINHHRQQPDKNMEQMQEHDQQRLLQEKIGCNCEAFSVKKKRGGKFSKKFSFRFKPKAKNAGSICEVSATWTPRPGPSPLGKFR